jgi:hypothetical protein
MTFSRSRTHGKASRFDPRENTRILKARSFVGIPERAFSVPVDTICSGINVSAPVVVVADAQSRCSGFGDDPPAQRLDLSRLALARQIALPPSGAGHGLKRPANKLDGAFHPGAILLRLTLPRQFHQRCKLVQAAAQSTWIVCHDPHNSTTCPSLR